MLKKVTISVIVTCHNLEKYLDECIKSIESQTLQPTEVIVVHDACSSPPGYAHTTTLHRSDHKGVARSRHEGVLVSAGEYLLFVDADDVLAENFIEMMVRTSITKAGDVVYPDVLLWSRWGESKFPNKWHESPKKITHKGMYAKCPVVVTSMMHRHVYEDVGGFKDLPLYEDWYFHLKALSLGFLYEKAPTYLKYRQRQNSRNRAPDDLRNQIWNEIRDKFELKEGVLHEKKS